MHRKTFSRSMRKGQSVRQRCLTASRRRILLLSALRWRHPYARSFQMEIAGVSLFPRHWFERPLKVVCRQFRGDVRFTPESGHVLCTSPCPLCAKSGHAYSMRRYFDLLFLLVGCSDLRFILALRG